MATQQEIAERLDLSERQVRNLLKDGVLPAGKGRGGYSEHDCTVAYIRHLRAQARKPDAQEMDPIIEALPGTIDYERLRLTREQADQLELKNELARAKVVPIDLFTAVLSQVAAEIAGLLDTLPLQVKRKHPQLETQVIEDIKWQCVKAQNAMARADTVADQVITDHVASLESD